VSDWSFDLTGRPLLTSALLVLAFVPLERAFAPRDDRRAEIGRDLLFASAGAIAIEVGIVFAVLPSLLVLHALAPPFEILSFARGRSWDAPAEVLVGLFVWDLSGFVYHRAAHRVPLLWRLHRVHHSSRDLDSLSAFRVHPVETCLLTLVQNAPLVLLGIPLGTHVLVLLLLRAHEVFVHSRLVVEPRVVRPWIALPAFHRRHHEEGAVPANFAALFPLWDRIAGTFETAPAAETRYTLAEWPSSTHPSAAPSSTARARSSSWRAPEAGRHA
jgi:sterol desaturase/sphingolipid hydroxylase (fatty acid hydroxylase superfamily)